MVKYLAEEFKLDEPREGDIHDEILDFFNVKVEQKEAEKKEAESKKKKSKK